MLNHIVIMGRLTRDPELRRTGNGTAVASFAIACDRDYKPQDGDRECDFFDVVAWRQTGEFVSKYFSKGRMAVVDGRLQTRSWTDNEGNKRRAVEIVADHVYFGDSKKDGGGDYHGDCHTSVSTGSQWSDNPTYSAPTQAAVDDYAMMPDDDDGQLPF